MRAFIFDKYGYYPPNEDDISFKIEGWTFTLEQAEKTEDELARLDEFLQSFSKLIPNAGGRIVKNRDGLYLSKADQGNLVLVAAKDGEISFNDMAKIHRHFAGQMQEISYKLSETIELWGKKVDDVEERIIPSIKIDDYTYISAMEVMIYGLGMAENAIQYLSELRIDFGDRIPNLTVTHRRLSQLSSSVFFDPFNLVIDSPMRDIAEIFKEGLITIPELLRLLMQYSPSIMEVSYLFARILYPSNLFDIFDDHYVSRKDVKPRVIKYRNAVAEHSKNIKELHKILVKDYGIRPISWLIK